MGRVRPFIFHGRHGKISPKPQRPGKRANKSVKSRHSSQDVASLFRVVTTSIASTGAEIRRFKVTDYTRVLEFDLLGQLEPMMNLHLKP